jgi:hypothetical protein
MAQTGFTPIQLYSSSTPTNAPSAGNLTNDTKGSELAINIADKNLFFKDSTNAVNTVPIRQSGTSSNGWLSATDWNTFNNKQPAGTYVTSVTGTAPVVSSGGTTPAISMAAATTSVNGYLTSTDWNTFNNKQTALVSGTNIKTVSGTTLLGSGDLGTIGTAYGGTGLTSFTANGLLYASSTSALATSSNLTYSTNLQVTEGNLRCIKTSGVPTVLVQSNQASGSVAPTFQFYRTGASSIATPSNNNVGAVRFDGLDANNSFTNFGLINVEIFTNAAGGAPSAMTFYTSASGANATEKMRIQPSGGVSIGTTSDPGAGSLRVNSALFVSATSNQFYTGFTGAGSVILNPTTTINTKILEVAGGTDTSVPTFAVFYNSNSGAMNAANSTVKIGQMGATARSINATGTINASGADYAEYMTKAGDFTVAKGDVVGINADGKLTNVFTDAVTFVVKSTSPSYVGGDIWGTEEAIGASNPQQPTRILDKTEQRIVSEATENKEAVYETVVVSVAETDEEWATREAPYLADKAVFEAALEAARQKVDRIAFSGQVPVNVTGAIPGQYIVPINDNGSIKGEAISNPTFEQYQISVGKVIAIEDDGRARIIVKTA